MATRSAIRLSAATTALTSASDSPACAIESEGSGSSAVNSSAWPSSSGSTNAGQPRSARVPFHTSRAPGACVTPRTYSSTASSGGMMPGRAVGSATGSSRNVMA